MTTPRTAQKRSEAELLADLKALLFEEEHAQYENLHEQVNDPEKLAEHVNPLVDEKIEDLRRRFPEYFGSTITETIKTQIKESQDEVVEALYPIMGKLVKRFIRSEIALLSEKINAKMKSAFSFKGWWQRTKLKTKGVQQSDVILQSLAEPEFEDIFIIEKNSGLLVGSYSIHNNLDKDQIAGMLTAIKAFVEDAFDKGSQNLEFIEYQTFKLYIQSFHTFYIAVAISGVLTEDFKDKLNTHVLDFADKILSKKDNKLEPEELSPQVKAYFQNTDLGQDK